MSEHQNGCNCEDYQMPLQVGDIVPDIRMDYYDPIKKDFGTLSLGELREQGKYVILVFYPGDFTFVCTTELTALAEQYDRYKALGAEVISVSCDTKFVHLAWQRDEKHLHGVKFPMAADPTGEIAELFGIYVADKGYARRGTFIINPKGELLVSEIHIDFLGRNMEELMRRFKAILMIAKNPDKACPSKWKDENDPLLKPGADLVGKVSDTYNQ
ncbi:MAG: peroxiredoxin [bacterium]|nr:peroxiredoxin [bacterium]